MTYNEMIIEVSFGAVLIATLWPPPWRLMLGAATIVLSIAEYRGWF